MLKKILSSESCKNCKLCCGFNQDDIWETPIIFSELRQYIDEHQITGKKISYLDYEGSYLFDMPFEEDQKVVWCPMLTEDGCILQDQKPLDCKMWPFRVMRLKDMLVITVSPVCKTVSSLPISVLTEFVKDDFEEVLYAAAEEHPIIVKDYIDGYPILSIRKCD